MPTVESTPIAMPDADVVLFPAFFSAPESDHFLQSLSREIAWRQERLTVYGRTLDVPRLTAWYGDQGIEYSYSGITHRARAWTADLLEIRARIETIANGPGRRPPKLEPRPGTSDRGPSYRGTRRLALQFNSVLLNRYRSGSDSVSWHSDDERTLGDNPLIASVSFGQPRCFQFKHKHDGRLRKTLELPHGSLLLMGGVTQHCWRHQIPKSKRPLAERINLTYRRILPPRPPRRRE